MANTVSLRVNRTQAQNAAIEKGRIVLSQNVIFEGKNGIYEIAADQRIGSGGESQVYIAKRQSDGKEFVAKIYDQFQAANQRNRNKVIEFILSHQDYTETHIMPLIDYGTVSLMNDDDALDYKTPVDILPYCKDSEIVKADFVTLKSKIIPQMLKALNLMHQSHLVHRDIKPGNVYWYNGQVVIADFGTACEIDENVDPTAQFYGTRLKRGTLGYAAPELWQGYAVVESDFFSLGCTVASFYKGEHVYQRLIELKDDGAINRAISTNGLPLNCHSSDQALQPLVDALVLLDEKKRAGYDDVKLWLSDPGVFERKFNGKRNAGETPQDFSFHFESRICNNKQELVNAFVADWETAKDYLYRGGVKNSTIVNFFSKNDQSLAMKANRIIEERDTATNFDLGLAKLLHFICSGGPIYWMGKTYNRLSDVSGAISDGTATSGEIEALLKSKYLSWKLESGTDEAKKSLPMVNQIESVAEKYPRIALNLALYMFAPSERKLLYNGAKTADDVFTQLIKSETGLCRNWADDDEADKLLGFLFSLGYSENVLITKGAMKCQRVADMEIIYRLFEAVCDYKAAVREHYLNFGPKAHLYWLQKHTDLYSFNSPQSQKTKDNILGVKLSSSMSIDELAKSFLVLKEFEKDFLQQFQGNILLAFMGINKGMDKNGITSENSDAYYLEEFCGNPVPAGFIRFIKASKSH